MVSCERKTELESKLIGLQQLKAFIVELEQECITELMTESPVSCFDCGKLFTTNTLPTKCPECEGTHLVDPFTGDDL